MFEPKADFRGFPNTPALDQAQALPISTSAQQPAPVGSVAVGSNSGSFGTGSGSETLVTGNSIYLTTSGRPVFLTLRPDPTTDGQRGYIQLVNNAAGNVSGAIVIRRNGIWVGGAQLTDVTGTGSSRDWRCAPSTISMWDFPPAGVQNYQLLAFLITGTNIFVSFANLVAFEPAALV